MRSHFAIALCITAAIVVGVTVAAISVPNPATSEVVVSGDALEIIIESPDAVQVGQLAVIDASKTDADSYAWTVAPSSEFRLFEGGTHLVFANALPGDYLFVIAAAKGGKIGMLEKIVTVEGQAPTPGPEGFSGRLTRVFDEVKSPDKKTEGTKLSETFKTVASMIAAGVLKTLDDVQTATFEMNKDALGANRELWSPVSAEISAEMQKRAENGTLSTLQEHQAAWREVAEILRQAAEKVK